MQHLMSKAIWPKFADKPIREWTYKCYAKGVLLPEASRMIFSGRCSHRDTMSREILGDLGGTMGVCKVRLGCSKVPCIA